MENTFPLSRGLKQKLGIHDQHVSEWCRQSQRQQALAKLLDTPAKRAFAAQWCGTLDSLLESQRRHKYERVAKGYRESYYWEKL